MRIQTQLALTILTCSLSGLLLAVGLSYGFIHLNNDSTRAGSDSLALQDVKRLQILTQEWMIITDLVIASDIIHLSDAAIAQGERILSEVSHITSTPRGMTDHDALAEITSSVTGINKLIVKSLTLTPNDKESKNFIGPYNETTQGLKSAIASLSRAMTLDTTRIQKALDARKDQLYLFAWLFSALYISVVTAVWWANVKSLVTPLQMLTDSARTARSASRSFHLKEAGPAEIRELNRSFTALLSTVEGAAIRQTAIVDTSTAGILVLDSQLCILSSNPSAESIFRTPKKDLVGKAIAELIPVLADARILESLLKCREGSLLQKEGIIFQGELRGGRVFPIDVSLVQTFFNSAHHFVLSIRNISQQRQLEMQLQQAKKFESLGQVARRVAHEVNSPLQYLQSNLEFIKESTQDLIHLQTEIQEYLVQGSDVSLIEVRQKLEALQEAADLQYIMAELPASCDQAVTSLQIVAKIMQSLKSVTVDDVSDLEEHDLHALIDKVTVKTREQTPSHIEILTDLERPKLSILCKPTDLELSIQHILMNAVQALDSPAGQNAAYRPQIQISTKTDHDSVFISITDNGPGIPEEIQDKIFDPFFSTKDSMGQGLSLARTIVTQRHRGSIELKSSPGDTCFSIQLPLG